MRMGAIGWCGIWFFLLRNCTKLDANGLKEMLHFNKIHILAIYGGCWIKIASHNQTQCNTTNSISRNNDGNHKSLCPLHRHPHPNAYRRVLQSPSQRPASLSLTALHRSHWGGRISNSHGTLFALHPESGLSEPSVNLWASQSGDQCQVGVSCLQLAAFHLDFTFSFPLGFLLVSERPPKSRCEDAWPGGRYDTNLLCS